MPTPPPAPPTDSDDPADQPPPPFWGVGMTLIIAFCALMVAEFFKLIGYALTIGLGLATPGADGEMTGNVGIINFVAISAATIGTLFFLTLVIRARRGAPLREYVGLYRPRLRSVMIGVLAVAAGTIIMRLIAEYVLKVPTVSASVVETVAKDNYPMLLVFSVMFLPPFLDEFLWRGFVLRGLTERINEDYAAALTTLLWAASRLPDYAGAANGSFYVVDILIEGFVLCYAWTKTRSLPLCIGLHMLFNVVFMIELFQHLQT